MRVSRWLVVFTLLGGIATPAAAQAPTARVLRFQIDSVHSRIGFRVRHLGVSWVTGSFRSFGGTIAWDSINPDRSVAEARIATASVFTDSERRDADLRSSNFFAADSFPEIRFTSRRVERGAAPNRFTLHGDLTIRGVTRPVALEAEVIGMAGGARLRLAGFTLSGVINRRDFGLQFNRLVEGIAVVGDEVQLVIEVEARANPAAPAG